LYQYACYGTIGIIVIIIVIIIIILNCLPLVVKIPRVKSKAKSKSNAGTARSRPQGLCGQKCPEWQLRCIAELPLTGVGTGRRSRISDSSDAPSQLAQKFNAVAYLWLPWFLPQLE